MKHTKFPLVLLSLLAFSTACKEKAASPVSTKNKSAEAGVAEIVDATIGIEAKAIPVEIRADKLAYMAGDQFPYTGNSVELFPASPPRVMHVVPFTKGLRSGKELTFYRNGVIKLEKIWEGGIAKSERVFYKDGQLKTEMGCTPEGTPFGPHKIYHPNGQLMIVNTLSREARPTGNEKRYNDQGVQIGEYLLDDGTLKQVISETEEGKVIREQGDAERAKKEAEAAAIK